MKPNFKHRAQGNFIQKDTQKKRYKDIHKRLEGKRNTAIIKRLIETKKIIDNDKPVSRGRIARKQKSRIFKNNFTWKIVNIAYLVYTCKTANEDNVEE